MQDSFCWIEYFGNTLASAQKINMLNDLLRAENFSRFSRYESSLRQCEQTYLRSRPSWYRTHTRWLRRVHSLHCTSCSSSRLLFVFSINLDFGTRLQVCEDHISGRDTHLSSKFNNIINSKSDLHHTIDSAIHTVCHLPRLLDLRHPWSILGSTRAWLAGQSYQQKYGIACPGRWCNSAVRCNTVQQA